jgi:hypothetical protein
MQIQWLLQEMITKSKLGVFQRDNLSQKELFLMKLEKLREVELLLCQRSLILSALELSLIALKTVILL